MAKEFGTQLRQMNSTTFNGKYFMDSLKKDKLGKKVHHV